jgi:transposase
MGREGVPMLRPEEWMDIGVLHREGHSIKSIARMTGRSRNTIRNVISQKILRRRPPKRRPSKLDPYKEYVKERYESCALSAVRLLEELRPMGYTGSVIVLRRYLRSLRPRRERAAKLTVRYETPPGKQGQADWGYCGRFADAAGKLISIYAFVVVLSFSRMMFVRFTTSMKLAELIRCHLEAFTYFGGWPEQMLYDNMKQVRLGPEQWNPLFLDFANHYGFVPKTHRIRRPRTKGKVERMVDYLKDNFLNGRSFDDLEALNAQVMHWLNATANVRIHATTGEQPVVLWRQEPIVALSSVAPYQIVDYLPRKADWESFVHFERRRYSVPPEYAGKPLLVGRSGEQIIVRSGDCIIAEHRAAARAGDCVADPDHVAALWKLTLGRTASEIVPKWEVRFNSAVDVRPLSVYQEAIR